MRTDSSPSLRSAALPVPLAAARFVMLMAVAAIWSLAPKATAQSTPTMPPGFAAHRHFTTQMQVPFVRRALVASSGMTFVAIANQVFVTAHTLGSNQQPRLRLPNEDVAFFAQESGSGGRVLVGGLASGSVHCLDATSGQLLASYAGVANAFDAEPIANGRLLLSANPAWPAGGANSGVWLVGPGLVPRLLLQLTGPSGPLVRLANGDLVVGELGPIVPPPPGAARLLRFPAALVQQAIAGGTLTVADAVQTGTGFAGLYDLVADDEGRLLVSDPASGVVVRTAPGGLVPVGPWLDVGPSAFVTTLQRHDRGAAPLAAFQPSERSPLVFATITDFTNQLGLLACGPKRPFASIEPSRQLAVGTSTHTITGAPALGIGVMLACLQTPVPEQPIAWLGGTPLWLGLDPNGVVPFAPFALDAQGGASVPFVNAGGFDVDVHFQTVVFAPGSGAVASTSPLTAHLLP